jgi:protein-tyrosine phosphatase
MAKHFLLSGLLAACVFLAGCEQGPASLPAEQRPIPAQLPVEQRESLRQLPFENAPNFRDLGGYKSSDGRSVRWGMVYRSGELSKLSADDEYYLERLGLKRIVDFRSEKERSEAPDRVAPDSAIAMVRMPMPVFGADFSMIKEMIDSGNLERDKLANVLVVANRQLVTDYTDVYKQWFDDLLATNGMPMMFHCTAGKDRTGLAAALLLLALDVPMDTVMNDYLATNTYTADKIDKTIRWVNYGSLFQTDGEALRPVLGVEKAYLEAAFATIDREYGSLDNYFVEGLGLTADKRQQLKNLLLQ